MAGDLTKAKLFEVMRLGPVWEARQCSDEPNTAPLTPSEVPAEPESVLSDCAARPNVTHEDQNADEQQVSDLSTITSIESLTTAVSNCKACALAESRQQTVFADGVANSPLMVIGEAPGVDEDRAGLPFVGRAGQLLERMLSAIDCSRKQNVYIANVIKCHPPANRDPRVDEINACMGYLTRQIALNKPDVILLVGKVPIKALLGTAQPIGELRGQIHKLEVGGEVFDAVVSYHPAYLLRSPTAKAKAWEDLLLVRRLLANKALEA